MKSLKMGNVLKNPKQNKERKSVTKKKKMVINGYMVSV